MNISAAFDQVKSQALEFAESLDVEETPTTAFSLLSLNKYKNLIIKPLMAVVLATSMSNAFAAPGPDFVSDKLQTPIVEVQEAAESPFSIHDHPTKSGKKLYVFQGGSDNITASNRALIQEFYQNVFTVEKAYMTLSYAQVENVKSVDEFIDTALDSRALAFPDIDFIVINEGQINAGMDDIHPDHALFRQHRLEWVIQHEIGHTTLPHLSTDFDSHLYTETLADMYGVLMVAKNHQLELNDTLTLIDQVTDYRFRFVDKLHKTPHESEATDHMTFMGMNALKVVLEKGIDLSSQSPADIAQLCGDIAETIAHYDFAEVRDEIGATKERNFERFKKSILIARAKLNELDGDRKQLYFEHLNHREAVQAARLAGFAKHLDDEAYLARYDKLLKRSFRSSGDFEVEAQHLMMDMALRGMVKELRDPDTFAAVTDEIVKKITPALEISQDQQSKLMEQHLQDQAQTKPNSGPEMDI